MHKIKVILADDHNVVRQGLRALLATVEDLEIVAEAENGRQAVQLARQHQPEVVVLDIAMPGLNGIEAARQIIRATPATKVLVLTSYGDDEFVHQLVEAGATGYLLKQSAAHELIQAIREVQKGNSFFSAAVARRLREQAHQSFLSGKPASPPSQQLTPREREVLQLIAEGLANKQIAAELGISIKTIEKHRQQVMNKLGLHDVASLTRHAISKGMVENRVGLKLQ